MSPFGSNQAIFNSVTPFNILVTNDYNKAPYMKMYK